MSNKDYSHPLFGANLRTLIKLFKRAEYLKASKRGLALLIILAGIGRFPFTLIERLWVLLRHRRSNLEEDPVFILGHWRSGTTHLYNVMSKADRFGYVTPFSAALPWDILVIGRLFAPILHRSLPSSRYIDNVKVDPISPQEDEIALANMTDISYYHALYFPTQFDAYFDQGVFFDDLTPKSLKNWESTLRYLYIKLSLDQGGQQLLIKNPVYTARAEHLRGMFPGAKFIHIHRHPYKVFVSMRNFYEKLLAQFAFQDYAHIDIDAVIFKTYRRMMTNLKAQSQTLPASQYAEIRFDNFQSDPLGELSRVYKQLDLGDFDIDKAGFQKYLDSIQSYKKNRFDLPPDLIAKIDENWSDLYADWGYATST